MLSKSVLLILVMGLLLVFSVYAIPTVEMGSIQGVHYAEAARTKVVNINDLKSRNIDGALAEKFAYIRGYKDGETGRAMNTFSLSNERQIVGLTPIVQQSSLFITEQLLAKANRGRYLKAYRTGYSDARAGLDRVVPNDFYKQYDLIFEEPKQEKASPLLQNRQGIFLQYGITFEMTVQEIAAAIGAKDAKDGKGKAPLTILTRLAVLENADARKLYRTLVQEKGLFINTYNAAYSAVNPPQEKVENFGSVPQSQKPTIIKERDAREVGAKYGKIDAFLSRNKRPFHLLYSRWDLVGVTDAEIAAAKAERAAYTEAYNNAYAQTTTQVSQKRISWAQRIYEMGYLHGLDDNAVGHASSPHDALNIYLIKRRNTNSEDLRINKYLGLYRQEFLEGYREGYTGK